MSRTIVHLSDLHFNWIDESLLDPLAGTIAELAPDILAISGDFTQHAWPAEFKAAAEFVERLPGRRIFVPGNHDMAFLNPVRRVTQRLRLYRKYITPDPLPFYADAEIAILGMNTARVEHLRDGRIRRWQVNLLEQRMAQATAGAVRVLVTHHPFDLPEAFHAREIIGRGSEAIARVSRSVDLRLAGHMHISHSGPTAERYKIAGQSAVFVQAGTAISIRSRGESNAFQFLRLSTDAIEVETRTWMAEERTYAAAAISRFVRSAHGWSRVLPSAQS